MKTESDSNRYLAGLMLGALGVVYGDIGTSPLYAFRECFHGTHPVPANPLSILGVTSLIFWLLILIVSVKYLGIVMRANNKGEGGILALLSLAFPERSNEKRRVALLAAVGVFGAALLYGDGMITPAISVLSAVEGLKVATPMFEPYILPITVGIIIVLFSMQRVGTKLVGTIFGPITLAWFAAIAVLGIRGITFAPEILKAVNPYYAVVFLLKSGWHGFAVLGAVFLAVTGTEALYADMGHFGIRPIRRAWFFLVLPALFLNYAGQGALLLHDPGATENPFFILSPRWALYPLVALATCAAVIASQALISGAFSLTMHAIQLGYLPRLAIQHTSSTQRGQIYLPSVNWFLMVACLGLVLGFKSSSNLAAAYGIAVSLTVIITTCLLYFAARRLWHWPRWQAFLVCAFFLIIELVFLGANALKFIHGGWFPIAIGGIVFMLMSTWRAGRRVLWEQVKSVALPYAIFLEDVRTIRPLRVPGTAVFMSGNPNGTPLALLHHLKHSKVLHERVVVLTIQIQEVPNIQSSERVEIEEVDKGFWRVVGRYGFMEEPSIAVIFASCRQLGLAMTMDQTTFFLSRETIIPTERRSRLMSWQKRLFALMARNAQPATSFFRLPANRVVELGMQVEL